MLTRTQANLFAVRISDDSNGSSVVLGVTGSLLLISDPARPDSIPTFIQAGLGRLI
jgi:hypothetical protein